MNIFKRLNTMRAFYISTVTLLALPLIAFAGVPFPGKLPVTVVSIEAANIINVNLETWPGFRRDVRITLPGLVIPGQGENVKECELELANLAIEFTVNFLNDAKNIRVKDMVMEHSASTDAISSIYTKAGTLDNALRHEHLARPNTVAANEPWC